MSKKLGTSIDDLAVRHSEHVQELENQLKEQDKLLNQYKKTHGKMEVMTHRIISYVKPLTPLPSIYTPPAKKSIVESPIVLYCKINDQHVGKRVEGFEVEGFNDYNWDICQKRGIGFSNVTNRITDVLRYSHTINEAVVAVLGDLINGELRTDDIATNEFQIPEQIVKAAGLLAKQLGLLSQNFEKIRVEFVTEDNHGRTERQILNKKAGVNSFNYTLAYLTKSYLAKHTNIEFNIHPCNETVIQVGSSRYLVGHGHNIIGWMGLPYYSIERKVARESTARMKLIMDRIDKEADIAKRIGFDKYDIGHWHIAVEHPLYNINPSPSGTDQYDHQQGRLGIPGQTIWFEHPKYKIQHKNVIDLSKIA